MDLEQKTRIKDFIERWKNAEGNEDREARSFIIEFLTEVLGIKDPTKILSFERPVRGRKIDAFYEDMGILIEAKSRKPGILDERRDNKRYGMETPYEQAKWYANELPPSITPRWIILTDFDEFRIHDLEKDNPQRDYETVKLDNLLDEKYLFDFFFDKSQSRLVKEKELSIEAGEIVGRLYNSLMTQYRNIETDPEEQRSLNILIVRLVFLLYAEDADLLQEHQAFLKYMRDVAPENFRETLIKLFEVLDTPEDERDPYLNEKLLAFPYINGSLFKKENIIIPQFTAEIKETLLREASAEFDWKNISPTIFGAAFESTLNPETRRAGGMHYTSIENIHKVIDPLFLDDLKEELVKIEGISVEKQRRFELRAFQDKLASLKIFDPACGSGNFLTESYVQLRTLENRVISGFQRDNAQTLTMDFDEGGQLATIKVSIDQFYGIEINDFAVSVAKTALWIAESQMAAKTEEVIGSYIPSFPLSNISNIVQGNALTIDWDEVISAFECNYIIGNPPFVGSSYCTKEQKDEIVNLFGKIKLSNSLDYVSGWYYKAAEMMDINPNVKTAFVSTNSITQGEQVAPFWGTLIEKFGIHIDFAWTTFIWDSEAADQAHVHCVIIGFSRKPSSKKVLFTEDEVIECQTINPYLKDAPVVYVTSRAQSLSDVPKIMHGNKPSDGGYLILSEEEREDILRKDPELAKYIHQYSGGVDFLRNKIRYCFWIPDISEREIYEHPILKERVEGVRESRLASSAKATQAKADTPNKFFTITQPESGNMLVAPQVSSGRRQYMPFGFYPSEIIVSDKLLMMPYASLYEFGILSSGFHNAWIRNVAGRLKSDFTYSVNVVYNNYVWPSPTPEQKQKIESLAQNILDIRDSYPDKSLADLYDPDKMPFDLKAAHEQLDKAVEEAYGVDFNGDEEKIVSHLFKLYAEATKE